MRIKVVLSKEGFTIPISYQHIIQGVIYSLLSKDDLGDFYHNTGYKYDKKTFKCFTFSQLFGKYKIINKKLVFDKEFYFYISSQDEKFLERIYKTLISNDYLSICRQVVSIDDITIINLKPFSGIKNLTINTLSPLLIYSTKDNFSTYYKPSDQNSLEFIINNIRDKSLAYNYPLNDLVFNINHVVFEKRRMVKFKDCYYECYMSKINIDVNYETLLFIYNCGLSSKGSCGFGMIDVDNEKGNLFI